MPPAKRKRVEAKKKAYKNPRNVYLKKITSQALNFKQTPSIPLPSQFRTTLRYSTYQVVINPGAAGTVSSHIFSANGLYDPDITGTGHQPIGFDQFMAMYDHYVVQRSRMTIQVSNRDGSYSQVVVLSLQDDVTATGNLDTMIENGQSVNAMVTPAGGSKAHCTLSLSADVLKFLGKKTGDASEIKGSASANPTEQCFFHISIAPNQGVDSSQCDVVVLLEYDVMFVEPVLLTAS